MGARRHVPFCVQSHHSSPPSSNPMRIIMRTAVLMMMFAQRAAATFTIVTPSTPFTNQSIYCTVLTSKIGPQPPVAKAISGDAIMFTGDLCNTAQVAAAPVNGRVVINVGQINCVHSIVYNNFRAQNVSALLISKIRRGMSRPSASHTKLVAPTGMGSVPGAGYYRSYAIVGYPNDMMYLVIQERQSDGILLSAFLKSQATIRVVFFPDPNVYKPLFDGWIYQVFVRWIPTVSFIVVALITAACMVMHVFLQAHSYKQLKLPIALDTWTRRIRHAWGNCSLVHLMLPIEFTSCIALAWVLIRSVVILTSSTSNLVIKTTSVIQCSADVLNSSTGWASILLPDGNLSQVMLYFSSALKGWGFTCDIMSAQIWHRLQAELGAFAGKRDLSWMGQALNHHIIGPMFILIPLIGDLALSYTLSLGTTANTFVIFASMLGVFAQTIVGIHFVRTSHSYLAIISTVFNVETTPKGEKETNANTRKGKKDPNAKTMPTGEKDSNAKTTPTGEKYSNAKIELKVEKESKETAFVRRLLKWQALLGVVMISYVFVMLILVTPYFYTLTGWTVYWAGVFNTRALSSLCRVMMTRPKMLSRDTLRSLIFKSASSRTQSMPMKIAGGSLAGATLVVTAKSTGRSAIW